MVMGRLRDLLSGLFRSGSVDQPRTETTATSHSPSPASQPDPSPPSGDAVRPGDTATGFSSSTRERKQEKSHVSVPRQPVVVGIDFGTSGTKVAFRSFGDRRRIPIVIDFGTDLEGYCRFSFPSAVRLSGDRVVVGRAAIHARSSDDVIVRSPKVGLLHPTGRKWAGVDGDLDSPALEEVASALVVADAIRTAKAVIRDTIGENHGALLFNIDIPVKDADRPEVSRRFHRVLSVALEFAEHLDRESTVLQVSDAWRDLRAAEGSGGDLIPEAQAVIHGIRKLARLEPDELHAVLDVGAGTVDMGIFKIVTRKVGANVAFWGATSEPGGCDDLDARLQDTLGLSDDVLPGLQAAKVRLLQTKQPQRVGGCTLDMSHINVAAEWLADRYASPYGRVFGEAYKKDRRNSRWKTLRTLVVGGGSLVPRLTECLCRPPRDFVDVHPVKLNSGMECRVAGDSVHGPSDDELPFLIPAIGLSHSRAELDDVTLPSEVADDDTRERGPTGLYDYEVADT